MRSNLEPAWQATRDLRPGRAETRRFAESSVRSPDIKTMAAGPR